MKSIKINPPGKNTCLTIYKEATIIAKSEMEATHNVGVTCNQIGKCLHSIKETLNPQKANNITNNNPSPHTLKSFPHA